MVPALLLVATSAGAAERFALSIGANDGEPGEARLRYAERDASRVAAVLREMGGFAPENVALLTGVQADGVRRTLVSVNARIREAGPGAVLFVFYSGHADAKALHLGGTRLPLEELKQLVRGSAAQARVLVIDACRSGAATQVKGGRRGPEFVISLEEAGGLEGFAILTSSAAGEDSQESDALEASFFTHALASGLLGAADADASGTVTLGEVFNYAQARTVAATVSTVAGPQHPTFRYELGGRRDLVLTQQRMDDSRFGTLRFPSPGHYVLRDARGGGGVLAEVAFDKGERRLTLPAGSYFVTRRERDFLLEGELAVETRRERTVVDSQLRRVAFAQVVRKGGTERTHAVSIGLTGWARLPLYGLGVATGLGLVGRVDLPSLAVELRVARAGSSSGRVDSPLFLKTDETSVTLAGLHAFDLGSLTLGAGLELGGAWFRQTYGAGQHSDSQSRLVSPLLQLGGRVVGALHWRVELATPIYVFNPIPLEGTVVSLRMHGGAAWHF
ncbi:MAG: caspase family protein [Myxococcaceae bacterium]